MLWKESKTYWKKLDRIWWDIVEMDASNIKVIILANILMEKVRDLLYSVFEIIEFPWTFLQV